MAVVWRTASAKIGRGSLWCVVPASLLICLLAGCRQPVELSDAQVRISLTTPLERNMVKDQRLRVVVDLSSESEEPITGARVTAEVLDAAGALVGEFSCRPEPDRSGRYQSEIFVPPKDARPGVWRVSVTATQAESSTSNTIVVRVDDSLGAQVLAKQGFHLEIPPDWRIVEQEGTAERGSLLLDPAPTGDDKASLEILYLSGDVEVRREALRDFVLSYRLGEHTEGSSHVRQIVPVAIQGHRGFLARGGFVAIAGGSEANFTVNALRFYCDDSDRTFTAITASTSDPIMSEMSGILDEFDCHPVRAPQG